MVPDTPSRAPASAAAHPRSAADAALRACVEAARGTVSENTRRALKADLGVFAGWCAERRLEAVPARPETLAAFIDAMAGSRAPATVRRYVASIAGVHRALGRGRPAQSAAVRGALKRMHRAKGRRQAQARGLTWPLRQRLLAAAGSRVIDDRNRALVAVAYDAMLRRSELTELRVDDLIEEVDGSGALPVRRARPTRKAGGRGATVSLAPVGARLWRASPARRARCRRHEKALRQGVGDVLATCYVAARRALPWCAPRYRRAGGGFWPVRLPINTVIASRKPNCKGVWAPCRT